MLPKSWESWWIPLGLCVKGKGSVRESCGQNKNVKIEARLPSGLIIKYRIILYLTRLNTLPSVLATAM